jgi:hypothetical protein
MSPESWFSLTLGEKYAWNVENTQKWTWTLEGCTMCYLSRKLTW